MAWVGAKPDKFIIIGIILIILYFLYRSASASTAEGFESLIDRAIDRMNPLASSHNTLKHKIIPVGISEGSGALQRAMNQVALNIPTPQANSTGTISQIAPENQVSPRIDNENSFLGMVKFCKENGSGSDPFANAKFAESCGVCLSSGTLIDGSTFSDATGLLVYKKDKEKFDKERRDNNYPFTRAIPSATAGTCVGASKGTDALPVFAVNAKEFRSFRNRIACIKNGVFGNDCGVCLNNNKWSWVDTDGDYISTTLYLWGSGKAGVKIGGVSVGEQDLSMSKASVYKLGPVEEGASVELNIEDEEGPFVYGAIYSQTPSEGIYRLAIDRFMEKDTSTGSFPRSGGTQSFSAEGVSVSCIQLKAQKKKKKLNIMGQFPLTFADSNQLSTFDCPNAPYVINAEDMGLFSTTDPCLNPPRQGPGNYTDQCLQATLSAGGCSTNGGWYSDLTDLRTDMGNASVSAIKTTIMGGSQTDKEFMRKCKGIDIGTPCDAFMGANAGTIPNVACLNFLYTNESASSSVGAAYNANPSSASTSSASSTATPTFCRPAGTLNPQNASGAGELITAAQGYDGLKGIEAVKAYLTAVFTKAVGNLDLNKPDSQGGRNDSWNKCIGLYVAPADEVKVTSPTATASATASASCNKQGNPVANSDSQCDATGKRQRKKWSFSSSSSDSCMEVADGSPTCDTTCPKATEAGCPNSGYVVASTKPSVPRNLKIGTLIPKNDEYSWTLPITWDPPSDMGTSDLRHYKFTITDYYSLHNPDATLVETGSTSVNITVFYGSRYVFNVSAVTNDGEGPAATTGRYTTPPFAPPCTFEGQRCGAQRWAQ